ncbi:mRNA-decapping enzyme-like protein isoform X1 [Iris pallida]|uniref:mRNA-decapping enzyme-like protein isoform X1 n=1 Tax=Iris pallida TaxID=29817 RepID=A0AAX6G6V2_IRIPA|nr:mRNA-decapping enzyme-like protein isoform X1 [Iris pallida]
MKMQSRGGGKPVPHLDKKSTRALNLTVLQRIDPSVEDILITAAHVALYEFNIQQIQWGRKDVEGSLFVVKRNTQPRFQFVVMNRRSTDNLVEDILGDFEYELQVPYLLYRNAAQEVNGIWFYNSQDCEDVANLISRILSAFSNVPPKSKDSSTKSNEFEELEDDPSIAVVEGPLEPTTSSAPSAPDVPDDSFANFFNAAMQAAMQAATNIGKTSNAEVAGQPHSAHIPSSPQAPSVLPFPPSSPSPLPFHSPPPMRPILDTLESGSSITYFPNLIKPPLCALPSSSSLAMPPMVSMPTAPQLNPLATVQRQYGSPLLQPFPPPTPPSSLTPAANNDPVITRERVRNAFLSLVQNNQFIDMVYWEMMNTHNP